MPSWSSRSPDIHTGGGDDGQMLRRFVEASRRAEIIAMVNEAASPVELGEAVTGELCEAFEAEIAFLVSARADGSPLECIGGTGLKDDHVARLLHDPLCVGALEADETTVRSGPALLGIGAREVAITPFTSADGDRAILGVARVYEQPFDEAELALLEAVTRSAGHALERGWLAQEHQRQAGQQAALARAAGLLNRTLDAGEVLDTLAREVALALGADIVVVYYGGDGGDGLTAVSAYGVPATFAGFRRAPGEGLCGAAVRTGKPQLSNAYQEEGRAPGSTAALNAVRTALSAPLRRHGAVDGAVSAGFVTERWVTQADLDLLVAFAELAGVACRNADELAEAQRAAALDSLTGCLSHAALQTRLRAEISRTELGDDPFALAIVDLDDFRSINERFGHLSGDSVLRAVGLLVRSAVRPGDEVARLGGDKFALLMPRTEERVAERVAEDVVAKIATAPLPGEGRLGSRAGIARWHPGEQATDVLSRAEHALSEAKLGRGERSHAVAGPLDDLYSAGAADHLARQDLNTRRLAAAARFGGQLSRLLDPRAIAEAAISELQEVLPCDRCAMVRLAEDGYVSAVAVASSNPAGLSWTQPQDHGSIGRCLRERRPVLVNDAQHDPVYAQTVGEGMRSELTVPLYSGPDLWGAIDLQSAELAAFSEHDAALVQTIADHIGTALRTADLYRRLEQAYLGTAEALAAALEAKDDYTADHARSIADLAVEVGRELDLDEDALRDLRYGAIFHDIGKIAIPDAILNKAGPLTDDEFEIVKAHPIVGEQILAPVPGLDGVRRIVRHDHERWDGTGYPDGLRGPQIPVGARIVLVVDSWHAMVSDRPYRKGIGDHAARKELEAFAGTQFDPAVVEAFIRVLDRRGSMVSDLI